MTGASGSGEQAAVATIAVTLQGPVQSLTVIARGDESARFLASTSAGNRAGGLARRSGGRAKTLLGDAL